MDLGYFQLHYFVRDDPVGAGENKNKTPDFVDEQLEVKYFEPILSYKSIFYSWLKKMCPRSAFVKTAQIYQ